VYNLAGPFLETTTKNKMNKILPFLLISLFFLGCTETIYEEVVKMDTLWLQRPALAPAFITQIDTIILTDTLETRVIIHETDTVVEYITRDSIIIKEVEKVVNHYDTILITETDTIRIIQHDTTILTVYDRSIIALDTLYLIGGMIRPTTSIPEELIPLLLEYGEISEQYGKAAPGAEMIIQYMPQSEMPGEGWHSFSFDFYNQYVIYLDVNVPLEQQRASMFRELMHLHHSKQYSNDPDKMMSPLWNPARTITKTDLDELFK
jgi:hypothetical protein